jgi:chromodomain-helicase-DNA-binding protein 4
MGGGICMGCKEVALEVDASILKKRKIPATIPEPSHAPDVSNSGNGDVVMTDEQQPSSTILLDEKTVDKEPLDQLLFRCITCKRVAHYAHLPIPPGSEDHIDLGDAIALAAHYTKEWECADCVSFTYHVDKILAWRPYPSQAVEPPCGPHEIPNIKSQLPREYLVKWIDRSYRRTQWVPHMWLATKSPTMLRTFLINGPKVELLAEAVTDAKQPAGNDAFGTSDVNLPPAFEIDAEDSRASSVKPDAKSLEFLTRPSPDAERKIPLAWKTADRVLDILLWSPDKRNELLKKKSEHNKSKGKGKDNGRGRRVVQSDDESDEINDPRIEAEYAASFNDGEQPSEDLTESVEEFEARKGRKLEVGDADRVIWAFIKWDDLGYDEGEGHLPLRHYHLLRLAFSSLVGFPPTPRRVRSCCFRGRF